jgi:hypothetical protein
MNTICYTDLDYYIMLKCMIPKLLYEVVATAPSYSINSMAI